MEINIKPLVRKKITLIGYICSILVILIHSSGYKYFQINDISVGGKFIIDIIDILTKYIPQVSVSMFFVISGFLFFYDSKKIENYGKRKYFKIKYYKRLKTLFIPYILWNTIWMLFTLILSNIPVISSKIESLKLFEPSLINFIKGVFLFEYSGVTWYIFYLIIYAILSPVIYCFMKKKWIAKIFLMVAFIISSITYNNEYLNYLNCFNSLFFYCLGVYLSIYCYSFINKKYGKREIFFAFIGCIISIIYFKSIYLNSFIDEAIRLIFVVSLWIVMDIFKMIKLKWWYEISFFIYVFHGMTQQSINKIICIILPTKGKSSAINALINTIGGAILTILLSTILAYILIKYFPKTWNYLNGYRKPQNFKYHNIEEFHIKI